MTKGEVTLCGKGRKRKKKGQERSVILLGEWGWVGLEWDDGKCYVLMGKTMRRRRGLGPGLERDPFSGPLDSTGELVDTP